MAIGFSGTQRLVRSATVPSTSLFSIAGWFYLPALPANGQYMTFASRDGGNCVQVLTTAGVCHFGIGTNTNDYMGSTSILANTWYAFGLTRNASNIHKAYLNGVLAATSSADTNAGSALIFGQYDQSTNAPLTGYLTLCRVWDGVELTAAEFLAESGSTTPVKSTGLWSYYNFAAAGSATTDNSGNSRTLTAVGTVTTQTDPSIGSGNVTATPSGVSATMSIGAPVINLTGTNVPTGLSATFGLGSPNVSTGANPTVNPAGLQMNSGIGTFTIEIDLTSIPLGVSATFGLGTPTVTNVGAIVPTGVALTSSLGAPTVVLPKTVSPTGLSSTLSLGSPSIITGGGLANNPVGLESTMLVGTPVVNLTQVIKPIGLSSTTRLGTPNVGSGGGGVTAGRRGGSRARRSPF